MIGRAELFGLPLSTEVDLPAVLASAEAALAGDGHGICATFVNPQAWQLARREADYAELLAGCDLVLADGIGVVVAARRLAGLPVSRLSFDATSLYRPVMGLLAAHRAPLFVLGAAPGIAARAVTRMRAEFPGLVLAGCRDGYGEPQAMLEEVLAAEPAAVLCGMGAPRQERFLAALRGAGFRGVAFTCGGFLDQLAAADAYYPAWVDRLELRWAWRLMREPGRLWRRYLLDYAPFLGHAARRLVSGTRVSAVGATSGGRG